jgi:hypothetical protein
MTLKDLEFALELSGVMSQDIDYILDFSKKNGIDKEQIDDELAKLGYDRFFENDFDNSWDDEDYGHIEKFPYKHTFLEDYD